MRSSRLKLNRLIIVCISAICCTISAYAQSAEEIVNLIFDIKMSGKYVYGSGTDSDKNIAYDFALDELLDNANERRYDEQKPALAKSDLISKTKDYTYVSDDETNVFLYIDIDLVMTLTPAQVSSQLSNVIAPQTGNANQSQSTSGNTTTDNPGTPVTPVTISQININTQPIQQNIGAERIYDMITLDVLEREMAIDVKRYLETRLKHNDISRLESAKSREEIPDDAYVVVIDRINGGYCVVSLLSPIKNGQRVNLKTNTPDSVYNYTKKAFMWYK